MTPALCNILKNIISFLRVEFYTSSFSDINFFVKFRSSPLLVFFFGTFLETNVTKLEKIPCLGLKFSGSEEAFHAWNAVHIEGSWRLVDTTFGAG
jgi:hypothetical protein